ncbi:MAG: aldehyde dehydrogenase family protein [Leptospiraceae bacterium]|nr:aldehyde dehydrogenase family protein [Leptospiraceae bacterium]
MYEKQQKHKREIKKTNSSTRIQKLKNLKKKIMEHKEMIFTALQNDFKKAPSESDLTEMIPSLMELDDAISNLHSWMKPKSVYSPFLLLPGASSKIICEPKGSVLIISPWNYPFLLSISPLIAAIAAGNVVIIKPSEFTTNTSAIMQKLLSEIFPEEEVTVIDGDASVASYLLEKRYDHVFFTGSTPVGRIIMQAAAKYLTPVTLELGGKSPVVVDKKVDLKDAAYKICWGKFVNSGQTCVAPDYVLVPEEMQSDFIQHAKESLRDLYGAKEEDWIANSDYARIINGKNHDRLVDLLEDSKQKGAKVEIGGIFNKQELYLSPTILSNIPENSKIMQEEIFGPILPIIPYKDLDFAIDFVNNREKPLALYVFSSSNHTAEKIISETSAGGTCINDVLMHLANPNLPFGGVGESGMGNYHGIYGFKTFSHERSVLKQFGLYNLTQIMYPPYKHSIIKDFLRNLI